MTPDDHAAVSAAIERHRDREGPLLPMLHDIQHALGWIPRDALPRVAAALNLSRAEVHGVVSYYHHFRTEPALAPVLQICRAESCQAMGADALWQHAARYPGCQVESTYCLGLCAQSPAAMLGDTPLARLTPERLDAAVAALACNAPAAAAATPLAAAGDAVATALATTAAAAATPAGVGR